MMVRFFEHEMSVLTDITDRGLQVYDHDDDEDAQRMVIRTVTVTPSTPERVPIFENTPSAAWSPLTPPSTGTGRCTRSRSKSFSPKNLHFSTTTTISTNRLRVSPRKRLLDGQSDHEMRGDLSPKKLKIELLEKTPTAFMPSLLALNSDQLVTLIGKLVDTDNDTNEKLLQLIPAPDLKQIDKELKHLRASINKSVANRTSRFVSKTDAVAFSRAQAHLQNFKRYLTSIGTRMIRSERWDTVVEFVLLAWNHVRLTPNWDKPYHNDIKNKCFKFLSNQMAESIQKGGFSANELCKIGDQAVLMLHDSDTIKTCLLLINNLNCNGSVS